MPDDREPRYVDLKTIMRTFGLSKSWVDRRVARGLITRRKFGRHSRYDPDEIELLGKTAAGEASGPSPPRDGRGRFDKRHPKPDQFNTT
jgi:hypothetical protein